MPNRFEFETDSDAKQIHIRNRFQHETDSNTKPIPTRNRFQRETDSNAKPISMRFRLYFSKTDFNAVQFTIWYVWLVKL